MKNNKKTVPLQVYFTPDVKVLNLLAEEATLLSESQLEDYNENIIG